MKKYLVEITIAEDRGTINKSHRTIKMLQGDPKDTILYGSVNMRIGKGATTYELDSPTVINVVDYTFTPGPRLRTEGKFSGEEFRDDYLIPRMSKKLTVGLDGVAGYGLGFLEEVFGGLVRLGYDLNLTIISNDEPYLIDEIKGYMNNAKKIKEKERQKIMKDFFDKEKK